MTIFKTEEWRPVVGYETIYEVSNYGKVRRHDNSPKGRSGEYLKVSSANRYPRVTLFSGDGSRSYHSIHDLVASSFIGPKPDGFHVDHINGNTWCNEAWNLEYVSAQENMRRCTERHLRVDGRRNKNAKLSEYDVLEIRRLSRDGISRAELGRRYGVSAPHISQIVSGKKWSIHP